jgi:hypothetical protein
MKAVIYMAVLDSIRWGDRSVARPASVNEWQKLKTLMSGAELFTEAHPFGGASPLGK